MASSNKRKTTMAKRDRERGLAERRLEKQARKVARKQAAADGAASAHEHPLVDEASQTLGDQPPASI